MHEIKKSGAGAAGNQKRRLLGAVEAVTKGGDLPGGAPGNALVPVATSLRTDHEALAAILRRADQRRIAVGRIAAGKVVGAMVLAKPRRSGRAWSPLTANEVTDLWNTRRARAFSVAGLPADGKNVISANSGDMAGREAHTVPLGCLPLPEDTCAQLICDLTVFESSVSLEAAVDALTRRGLKARVVLASNTRIDDATAAIEINRTVGLPAVYVGHQQKATDVQTLQINLAAISQLLHELIDLDTWATAVNEMFTPQLRPGTRSWSSLMSRGSGNSFTARTRAGLGSRAGVHDGARPWRTTFATLLNRHALRILPPPWSRRLGSWWFQKATALIPTTFGEHSDFSRHMLLPRSVRGDDRPRSEGCQ